MSTDAKDKDRVHRLLDIVVEEVSLVDRAANKHRFLIVKRSNEMDETTNGTGTAPAQEEQPATEAERPETKDGEEPEGAPETPGANENAEALGVALEALENLTGVVERLSAADGDEARTALADLAADLQATADKLAALAGAPGADEGEEGSPEKPAGGEDLADVIAAVRETLQRVGSLVEARGKKETAAASPPAPPNPTGQPASTGTGGLEPQIAGLVTEVRALTGAVREQQQRLARLEKRSGLPNSTPPGERPPCRGDEETVSWPQDLNRRCDRESVAKDVSFHEV
jgi:hypothetical protein